MNFETKREVLEWYERQPRTLNDQFLASIPWDEVRNYEIPPNLVPVLLYMRDVETLTDMYYRELRRTPTGRDPVISKFTERWGTEELTHGEVLNRFLHEAGVEVGESWQAQVQHTVTAFYTVYAYLLSAFTNLVGSKFTATHMTFGAIHEMTTAQGYRRLDEMANHPVLSTILKAIIREESAHTQFYWSVARLELQQSEFAQKVARFAIQYFWNPVGQGSKPREQTEYTVSTLFSGEGGIEKLDTTITKRVQQLPGFDGFTRITERISEICSESLKQMQSAEA